MTIIFLDLEKSLINIYNENGLRRIPLSSYNRLNHIIKDNNIFYVTEAIETTVESITETIDTLVESGTIEINEEEVIDNSEEKLYIRSASKSNILIPDLGIQFEGVLSPIPLQGFLKEYGENVLEENALLKRLIDENRIEIVPESEAIQSRQGAISEVVKKERAYDARLDNIIVDGPIDSYLDKIGESGPDDPIEIELGGNQTRSLSGGKGGNEGALLPDDFEVN